MSAEAELSNFDTERFIVEVHSKIALWDMTTEAYSNRDLKKKSLEELVDIFMNQEEATDVENNERDRFATSSINSASSLSANVLNNTSIPLQPATRQPFTPVHSPESVTSPGTQYSCDSEIYDIFQD
jgi:hypothetical protein